MATSAPLIGITGSSGQLGDRVASRLAVLGHHQRLLVRNPARAPHLPGAQIVQASYEEGASMRAALEGVQVLFPVSGYGPGRLGQHGSAIDATVAAGVERIVYTSFLAAAPQATFTHAREHFLTEQHIRLPVDTTGPAMILLAPRRSRWLRPPGSSRAPPVCQPPTSPKPSRRPERHGQASILRTGNSRPG